MRRWLLTIALALLPLGVWAQAPVILPPGDVTSPGVTFTTPGGPVTLPAGEYTTPGVTFTPKVEPPPVPPPTGSIYLQVLRENRLGWEDREGDRPYRVGFQVSTPTTLVVRAVREGMGTVVPTDIALRYLLDGQPISPALTTPPYAWSWDPANLSGAHSLCLEVTGSSRDQYRPIASQVFGAINTGAQRLPLLPQWLYTDLPSTGRGSFRPCEDGYLDYDPARQLAQAQPWRSRAVLSSTLNTAQRIPATGWVVEPAGYAPMQGYGSGVPSIMLRGPLQPSGQPVARAWHAQAGDWSEFSISKVERGPQIDGPRGIAMDSAYSTCVGLPSVDSPRYVCVNEAGRVYETVDGSMRTLYGPRQAKDDMPVEQVGIGPSIRGAQDISAFPGLDGLYFITDTFNHRIARLDCRVEPCTLTIIGGSTQWGNVNGPAATARFYRPYSIITHGPHACPGRPEFTDCYHHYVSDLRNNAIRNTKLYRPLANEMPEWETLVATGVYSPMVIRWASNWDIIIGETETGAIKRWNWATNSLTTIAPVVPWNASLVGEKWYWLDVDRLASCGPTDDIYVAVKTSSGQMYRIAADGSAPETLSGGGGHAFGPFNTTSDPAGHYRWAGDLHSTMAWPNAPKLCAYRTTGFGSMPARIIRPAIAGENLPVIDSACYSRGQTALSNGIRPFWMGLTGYARLGLPTYAEWANMGNADLKAAMRAVKPTATDAEIADASYAVRVQSPRYWVDGQAFACGVDPGPRTP